MKKKKRNKRGEIFIYKPLGDCGLGGVGWGVCVGGGEGGGSARAYDSFSLACVCVIWGVFSLGSFYAHVSEDFNCR